jgi:hypothetical protein
LTAHSSRLPYVRVSRDPSCRNTAAALQHTAWESHSW